MILNRKCKHKPQEPQPTSEVSSKENPTEGKPKPSLKAELLYFFKRLLAMIVLLYLIFGVVFGISAMPDDTMIPRMSAGDLMLYYRLEKQPQINNVVVLKKNNQRYVGRIIAQGGDTVDITEDNQLRINGNTIIEDRIYYPTGQYEDGINFPCTIPANEYFVMSDMRQGGKDSRIYGPVSKKELKGKVITVIRRSNL